MGRVRTSLCCASKKKREREIELKFDAPLALFRTKTTRHPQGRKREAIEKKNHGKKNKKTDPQTKVITSYAYIYTYGGHLSRNFCLLPSGPQNPQLPAVRVSCHTLKAGNKTKQIKTKRKKAGKKCKSNQNRKAHDHTSSSHHFTSQFTSHFTSLGKSVP